MQRKATVPISEFLARMLRVVIDDLSKADYVCKKRAIAAQTSPGYGKGEGR
jgi:hypothetical protein